MSNPKTEKLINAHLDFLDQTFAQPENIQSEFLHFYQWLRKQQLQDIWQFEHIYQLIEQQILLTPASDFLIEQIIEHCRFALIHPVNADTRIEDIISVHSIDKIALYLSKKSKQRQKLIHSIVNHAAFTAMLSQLIQHAIQDYIDNAMMAKKVPGVGRFMKMGKSVLESVTDSNLDDTLNHYLQKNMLKIIQLSEQVLNQHMDDNKLYHLQANIWHKIKGIPLSHLQGYLDHEDMDSVVKLSKEVWDHFRQTDYLKQQVHDGVYAWYVRNQERSFDLLLRDLNINEALVSNQLQALCTPLIQHMISQDYLRQRARHHLEQFYYAQHTQQILAE
ncbi:hypothetical protein [Acinetobacter rudis]|uniref:hypothetical protein n=1 Tax=Acinetobacter rudis TaxID=632955 RepID=UPI003341DA06